MRSRTWATRGRGTRTFSSREAYLAGREYCVAVCGPVIARGGRIERLPHPFAFGALERAAIGATARVSALRP